MLWIMPCYAKTLQSCPTLRDPMDCSSAGSSVHGIPQARILEWAAISYSRGPSQTRDGTHVSCLLPWQVGSLPLGPAGRPCSGSHGQTDIGASRGCEPTCPSLPGPQPSPGPPRASSSSLKACFPSLVAEPSLILSQQRPFPFLLGRLSHPRVKLNAFDAIFQYNWEHFERKLD